MVGSTIIKNFDILAKESKFLSYYKKQNITKKELSEIGEKLCLCKVKTQENCERDSLIELLFSIIGKNSRTTTLRQESLVLLLNIIKQIQDKKIITSQDFLEGMYFGLRS